MRPLRRCPRRPRVPESHGDGQHPCRGRPRQGHDRDRERCPGARGDRSRRAFDGDGRAHRRGGDLADRDRGCRRAPSGRAPGGCRPRRGRDVPRRGRHRRRRGPRARRAPRAHGHVPREARGDGGRHRADGDRGHRPLSRAAGGGRRLHAPVSGRGDRLQTAARHRPRRGLGRGDREREHLRGPLPLRRRAAPHGRGHPHRGSPRRRARGRAAVRRARARLPTSGPARRSSSRASSPRARRSSPGSSTSTGATRTSTASCGPSEPTSPAATIARPPGPEAARSPS